MSIAPRGTWRDGSARGGAAALATARGSAMPGPVGGMPSLGTPRLTADESLDVTTLEFFTARALEAQDKAKGATVAKKLQPKAAPEGRGFRSLPGRGAGHVRAG